MASGSICIKATPLASYVLRRADDALILGHRLSEWCGHAPMLEEDMALSNMGLDLIGQARALYTYAAELEGAGHTEDDLAYMRDERDYGNLLLVEQPNGDFAQTMLRQFFYSAFAELYWREMARASADQSLTAIAAKAEKEMSYHYRHSAEWVIRLGDGTAESRKRLLDALETLWRFTGELFDAGPDGQELIASRAVIDTGALIAPWREIVDRVFLEATLPMPAGGWMQSGGRVGRHSEHLGHILAELQYLQRTIPGAVW